MSREWVVGIDLGTTYFKIGLFDRDGRLTGLGRVAVETDGGSNGLKCELPIKRFDRLLETAWRDACRTAGTDPDAVRIGGISYSSQANSLILLDADDLPLTPLILWPDRRVPKVESLVEIYGHRSDRFATSGVGLAVGPRMGINKLAWIRRRTPALWRRTRRVMTVSDYLVWRLTGRRIGDLGTAGLLGIVDCRAGDWWPAALRDLQLEKNLLTPLAPPGTLVGATNGAATSLGFPAGIPFALGGLDHHMAAVGVGIPARAPVSVSLGTVLACVALEPEYHPVPDGYCGRGLKGQGFTVLTFCDNGGANLEWFQRQHAPNLTFPELDALADAVAPGCDGLRALPDAASHPGLQGFCHAGPHHTAGHYFRALMESSARSLATLLRPLGMPPSVVLTGGGARSDVWRRILGRETGADILTSDCEEPACRGAAMTAAVMAGWFASFDVAAAHWGRTQQ